MSEVRIIDRAYPGRYPVRRSVKETTATNSIEAQNEDKPSERRQSRDRRRNEKKKVFFERRLNKRRSRRVDITA